MSGLGAELDGLTVISIEQAVAAPYCGLLLADAGARVIKIERAEGDFARDYDHAALGNSVNFVWLNRGKESIVLDLDLDGDTALLRRMIQKADVLLSNLAPGALERRGITGAVLRATNPGLVTCEITGYGREGPYVARKAYDLLVQAEVGLCSITGSAGEPARVGLSLCDIATGLTAFSAILRALLLRFRTGQGIDLSVSMFDVLADWMNVPLLFYRYAGVTPQRMGVHHPGLAPYGLYKAKGGDGLLISVQSDREWRIFASEILKRPELGSDPRFARSPDRVANRTALNRDIDAVFSRHERDELIHMLLEAKIACARLSEMKDLNAHPQLRELEITGENGAPIRLADLPVRTESPRKSAVPALDAHGAALRAEFAS